ncbi:hypothetical protein QBC37DRAFT_374006 [Rhypophila decipiens]|uniref:Uncharacterized protein n=1 Tax=Rhypophila decipiens TaxID=261697 RepID=A0AAN6Y8V8_9PEZI|nr:hypothetical protein QBC37DRAFT_374006 [Rhypophila decipiens]
MTSTAPPGVPVTRDAAPHPGEWFLILHRGSGRPLTLLDGGFLRLGNGLTAGPASLANKSTPSYIKHKAYEDRYLWLCVEHNGWLGFRSPCGKYIGQSTEPGAGGDRHVLAATATHHLAREYFCPRKYPVDGYILMSPIGEKLFKVEVDDHKGIRRLVLR